MLDSHYMGRGVECALHGVGRRTSRSCVTRPQLALQLSMRVLATQVFLKLDNAGTHPVVSNWRGLLSSIGCVKLVVKVQRTLRTS